MLLPARYDVYRTPAVCERRPPAATSDARGEPAAVAAPPEEAEKAEAPPPEEAEKEAPPERAEPPLLRRVTCRVMRPAEEVMRSSSLAAALPWSSPRRHSVSPE